MINLELVRAKLERLLNGTPNTADSGENWTTLISPTTNAYAFGVKANGFRLDTIVDKVKNKNLVFAFVDSLGGEINNVKSLKEIDYNVSITLYYPVRFKDDFYELNDFLYDSFVEQFLNFGTDTNKQVCLCALSIPQYGEVGIANFKQLADFINDNYPLQTPITKSEPYMSMTFTLYLSSIKDLNVENGLLYGNSWSTRIKMYDGQNLIFDDENPIFITETNISNTEPISEQVLGEKYSKSLPVSTAYTKEIPIYVKNNEYYKNLISYYLDRELSDLSVEIIESNNVLFGTTTFTNTYFITNMSMVKAKGEMLGITLTLADRI